MVLFLNLITQEKEQFLKKNKLNKANLYKFFFLLFFFSIINSVKADENLIEIQKYFNNIKNFSANFIQIDEDIIQEGVFYLNKKRIKIEYLNPNKITIILDKDKAMYFNADLEEVEYFNPKESIAEIFYNIFFNDEIYTKSEITESQGNIVLRKKLNYEEKISITITFEKNPTHLRKIKIITEDTKIDLGIFGYNFDPIFNKNFFSMANPLI